MTRLFVFAEDFKVFNQPTEKLSLLENVIYRLVNDLFPGMVSMLVIVHSRDYTPPIYI